MASLNTQFSIAVHALAAIAHYDRPFTSAVLAGSVNANPIFVKRIMAKLSKAKLVEATVGKSGGYALGSSAKNISLLDIFHAVSPPSVFAIHTYEKKKWCAVSNNIKEVMGDVLASAQKKVDNDLERTTLADVVAKIRSKAQ